MTVTYSIVIPGNGTGQRFQNEMPKQFVLLRGKPLIYHTVNAFVQCSHQLNEEFKMNEIVISCSYDYEGYVHEEVVRPNVTQNNSIKIKLVRGGEFRHQSIFNCLKYLEKLYHGVEDHIVLIHDAVRPLVEVSLVGKLIENALKYGASGPVCNLSSTILREDKGFLDYALKRDEYRASEMPQSFKFNTILAAYKAANQKDIECGTECLDLVRKYTDCRVKLIASNANSLFKVTYRKDYFSALGMIRQKYSFRTLLLKDASLSRSSMLRFKSHLKFIHMNELDINSIEFEETESNECDIFFLFSAKSFHPISTNGGDTLDLIPKMNYGHLILIYLYRCEKDKYDLIRNYSQSFMQINKMTILLSPIDSGNIFNHAFFDKIKLICNNQKSMIAQFVRL